MNNITLKKKLSLFLILLLLISSLSGCYNTQNIDKLAYVVALGFDKGEGNNIKMTFQISIPSAEASGKSGSSSQSSNVVVNSINCSTINSGISLINSYISKKINISHCKVVIFSAELAYQGISEYLYTLLNDVEIRPDTNIIVSKCDAKTFIDNSKPTIEQLSARYYEIAPISSQYTGYTDNVSLGEFFSSLPDTFSEAYAILGSVNTPETHNTKSNTDGSKDSSYTAGETPINTEKANIENMGLAVFSGDKYVGDLNGVETICHMIVTNNLRTCTITIPSPFNNSDTIDLSLQLNKRTANKVDFVNDSPYIQTKVNLKATILSMNKDYSYLNEDNLKSMENFANSYIAQNISQFLYKTSKEYGSDICGLGKNAVSKFVFWKDWSKYNWLSNYRNAFFNVDVNTNISSSRIILNT